MDEGEQLRRRIAQMPDAELLDIVEGRDLGYREEAVLIAQEVLRSRNVPFAVVPFEHLDRAAAALHAVADAEAYVGQQRRLGRNLLIVGLGIFILPFFGLQFSFASALGAGAMLVGVVFVAAGSYLLSRTDHEAGESPPALDE